MGTFTDFFGNLQAHMGLFGPTFLMFCEVPLPVLLLTTLLVGIASSFREGVIFLTRLSTNGMIRQNYRTSSRTSYLEIPNEI